LSQIIFLKALTKKIINYHFKKYRNNNNYYY
jgi:hypothetical protein